MIPPDPIPPHPSSFGSGPCRLSACLGAGLGEASQASHAEKRGPALIAGFKNRRFRPGMGVGILFPLGRPFSPTNLFPRFRLPPPRHLHAKIPSAAGAGAPSWAGGGRGGGGVGPTTGKNG